MYSRTQTYKITGKDKSPNVHGRYQTAKNGIEKCAMPVIKSGKQYITGGMELQNQDKIRTLGEK